MNLCFSRPPARTTFLLWSFFQLVSVCLSVCLSVSVRACVCVCVVCVCALACVSLHQNLSPFSLASPLPSLPSPSSSVSLFAPSFLFSLLFSVTTLSLFSLSYSLFHNRSSHSLLCLLFSFPVFFSFVFLKWNGFEAKSQNHATQLKHSARAQLPYSPVYKTHLLS